MLRPADVLQPAAAGDVGRLPSDRVRLRRATQRQHRRVSGHRGRVRVPDRPRAGRWRFRTRRLRYAVMAASRAAWTSSRPARPPASSSATSTAVRLRGSVSTGQICRQQATASRRSLPNAARQSDRGEHPPGVRTDRPLVRVHRRPGPDVRRDDRRCGSPSPMTGQPRSRFGCGRRVRPDMAPGDRRPRECLPPRRWARTSGGSTPPSSTAPTGIGWRSNVRSSEIASASAAEVGDTHDRPRRVTFNGFRSQRSRLTSPAAEAP